MFSHHVYSNFYWNFFFSHCPYLYLEPLSLFFFLHRKCLFQIWAWCSCHTHSRSFFLYLNFKYVWRHFENYFHHRNLMAGNKIFAEIIKLQYWIPQRRQKIVEFGDRYLWTCQIPAMMDVLYGRYMSYKCIITCSRFCIQIVKLRCKVAINIA